MPVLPLSPSLAGRELARSVFSPSGELLLRQDTKLTPSLIDSLARRGVLALQVKDPYLQGIEEPDVIYEETRRVATARVRDAFGSFVKGGEIDPAPLLEVVTQLMDEVLEAYEGRAGLAVIRGYDEYTFTHSVNVCALSLLLGRASDLPEPQLRLLGLGALLHDVGKVLVPKEILEKEGPLTEEERQLMRRHTEFGFDLLGRVPGISALVRAVPYQHHERLDGSGYPRGLSGKAIHLFPQLVSVTDVFDAMCSSRAYRPALFEHEAAAFLLKNAGTKFDRSIVARFLKVVAIYPNGAVVRLRDGMLGVVERQTGSPVRPVVRIIANARNELVSPHSVDLTLRTDLGIQAVLRDYPEEVLEQIHPH